MVIVNQIFIIQNRIQIFNQLTFNLYGIIPNNENRYINVVLGLSALRYDNKYLGKLSGKEMVNNFLRQ